MRKTTLAVLALAALGLTGTSKAQSGSPLDAISDSKGDLFATGNNVITGLQACDSMKTNVETFQCSATLGFIYGVWQVLLGEGRLPFVGTGTVTLAQDEAVIKKYVSDHPELLNEPAWKFVMQAYVAAWGTKQK